MTMHEKAVAFAKELEKDPRIKELAEKQNAHELTEAETWEFVNRVDLMAYTSDFGIYENDDDAEW